MKKLLFIFLVISSLISCSQEKKEAKQKNENSTESKVAAVYETYEMEIEGMTCEIGCARTIESKLSKMEGVIYSKIYFESKKGIFTFNKNTINEKLIAEKIAGIAGGDLYSVVKFKKIDEIIK
jgi:mercuric ion binding protein